MTDQPTFGRYTEIPLDHMSAEQRKGYDYVMREREMCPGPYKIWVENPPLMNLIVPLGAYYKKYSTLNDAEREIATTLLVAKLGSAFAVSEHEWIAEDAGIPAEKVERMIIGLPVAFNDPRQQVIYEVTSALIDSRYVPIIEELIGPSSGAWSRLPGEYGKVAYFTTDGGTASPLPDGVRRPAKLLRIELPEVPAAFRS
jgi:4-carboxymuconolactone decarboxylase